MSGIVLSAVDLNSANNYNNGKTDENAINTNYETNIETDDNWNHKYAKAYNTNTDANIQSTPVDCTNNLNCSPTQNRSQTVNSIGSNNSSIVTLDEDDSSVIDSDSDIDDVMSNIVLANKDLDPSNFCQSSILCTNANAKPNIGSIGVQNSSDITFGNKTFFQGPVTIKQFIYDKIKWNEAEPPENDNLGYVKSSTDKLSRKQKDFSDANDQSDELQKRWTNKQALFSVVLAGIPVCSLAALILFVKYTSGVYNRNSSSSDIITDTAGPLRIISRSEWFAQLPEHKLIPLELPSTRVIIAHTATENCTTQASCTYQTRLIQTFHIERGWADIGYNFLVGGDGAVYVGIGWDTQGAHTKGYNTKSICIAFIGTFNKYVPPKRQLYAAQKMIEEGVKLKKLTDDYALYGHRQLIASESPGLALYDVVKKWDHWTEEIR